MATVVGLYVEHFKRRVPGRSAQAPIHDRKAELFGSPWAPVYEFTA